MSRSYKKTPRSGDKKDKFFKTYANRKIRRDKKEPLNNGNYKKAFCSYNICDWETIGYDFDAWLKESIQLQNTVRRNNSSLSKKEEYRKWYKSFKAK